METVKGHLKGILLSKLHVEIILLVQYSNRMDLHLKR